MAGGQSKNVDHMYRAATLGQSPRKNRKKPTDWSPLPSFNCIDSTSIESYYNCSNKGPPVSILETTISVRPHRTVLCLHLPSCVHLWRLFPPEDLSEESDLPLIRTEVSSSPGSCYQEPRSLCFNPNQFPGLSPSFWFKDYRNCKNLKWGTVDTIRFVATTKRIPVFCSISTRWLICTTRARPRKHSVTRLTQPIFHCYL